MEKRKIFFKECRNAAGWHGTFAGDCESVVGSTTTVHDIDPASGSAMF